MHRDVLTDVRKDVRGTFIKRMSLPDLTKCPPACSSVLRTFIINKLRAVSVWIFLHRVAILEFANEKHEHNEL